jgi:tetrahydromethanopterin S-methyltransferase subunit G
MGVVEDVRTVLQDLLTPEMREVRARLDDLKNRMDRLENRLDKFDSRLDDHEKSIEHRFQKAEESALRRHDETMFAVRSLIDFNTLNQRLSQLEKKTLSNPSDQ